ncbi:MAG: PrsW family glutamic-type intramembrane protease [Lachnospiraceae bacterium]|nr:PrsW family glutamic-type intramembrane protease [Lachnospiraceae bacterium]
MKFLIVTLSNIGILLVLTIFAQKKNTIDGQLKFYMKLFVFGVLISIPIILIESIIEFAMEQFVQTGNIFYAFLDAFIVAGFTEELFKWLVFNKYVLKKKDVNSRYDAIVYAAYISMGFSMIENVIYAFYGDISVCIIRSITSTPGHLFFSIFIGHYWFLSKKNALNGNKFKAAKYTIFSLLIPIILHGFYDFCLMSDSDGLKIIWILFVIGIIIKVFFIIKKTYFDRELMYSYLMLEDSRIH